jgi:hypothetical protein
MTLKDHLRSAERMYWRTQLDSGQSMREIARASGLSYRQIYCRMRKVGVRTERKGNNVKPRGRLLSAEDSASFLLLSPNERATVIGVIVDELRAKESKAIGRMRGLHRPKPTAHV